MRFSTSSSFSTNYRTLSSVQLPSHQAQRASSAARVPIGTEGSGSWISMSHSTSVWSGWGSRGLARGVPGGLVGIGGIQRKETIQYLKTAGLLPGEMNSLEAGNRRLESKIWEYLEKKGPRSETGGLLQDHGGPEGSGFCKFCRQCRIILQGDNDPSYS